MADISPASDPETAAFGCVLPSSGDILQKESLTSKQV
jgi:hypothetical protein